MKLLKDIKKAIENSKELKKLFATCNTGKEHGHSLATTVETVAVDVLINAGIATHKPKTEREIGDTYATKRIPINIKFSESKNTGKPNVASIKRLIKLLFANEIDAYIIVMIHSDLTCEVFDALSNVNLLSADGGTGQTMLEKSKMNEITLVDKTIINKKKDLMALFSKSFYAHLFNFTLRKTGYFRRMENYVTPKGKVKIEQAVKIMQKALADIKDLNIEKEVKY